MVSVRGIVCTCFEMLQLISWVAL